MGQRGTPAMIGEPASPERACRFHAHNAPLAPRTQETAVKGDTKVIEFLNKQLKQRTHRDQPVLPAPAHAQALGLRPPGQARVRRVDRGDEARRSADGAHPRCSRDCPTCRTSASCMVGEGAVEILSCDSEGRADRAQARSKDGIAHCESVRDYVSREVLQTDPARHRRAHRLARDPDRAGGQGGRA